MATGKILAAGTLTTLADLYPTAGVQDKSTIVSAIVVTNIHASSPSTVNLYLEMQDSGTNYHIIPKDLVLPAGAQVMVDQEIGLLLKTGPDRIQGSASGGTVHFVITGVESYA